MATLPCPPSDPCCCIKVTTKTVPTPCPPSQQDCCLKACNAVIACDDAIGPCGQSGTFDLSTLEHITTGCSGPVKYKLESHDGTFLSVSITQAGILTWVTPGEEFVDEFGTICFRITCETDCDDCVVLQSLGVIQIGIKNLCQGETCSEGESCDLCTGNCITIQVDTEVSSTAEAADTSVES